MIVKIRLVYNSRRHCYVTHQSTHALIKEICQIRIIPKIFGTRNIYEIEVEMNL